MENKFMYTAEDIAADLSISKVEAADLLKELQRRLKAMGKFVIADRVPAAWYEQQKESGFMKIGQQPENVPLSERRLLSIKDFCEYAGGINKELARKFVKETGLVVRIGEKMLVDRLRFDEWCTDQNRQQGKQ